MCALALGLLSWLALGCSSGPDPADSARRAAVARATFEAVLELAQRLADPDEARDQALLAEAIAARDDARQLDERRAGVAVRDLLPIVQRYFTDVHRAGRVGLVRFDGFDVGASIRRPSAGLEAAGEPGWMQERPFATHWSLDGRRQYRSAEVDGLRLRAARDLDAGTMELLDTRSRPLTAEALPLPPQFLWWRLVRGDSDTWTLWNFGSYRGALDLAEIPGIADDPLLRDVHGALVARIDGRLVVIAPCGEVIDLADDPADLTGALAEAEAAFLSDQVVSRRASPEVYVPTTRDVWLRLREGCRAHALSVLLGHSDDARLADTVRRVRLMLARHGAASAVTLIDWTWGLDGADPVLAELGWTREMLRPDLLNLAELEVAAWRQLHRDMRLQGGRDALFGALRPYAVRLDARYADPASEALLPGEPRPVGCPPNLAPVVRFIARMGGSLTEEGLGVLRQPAISGDTLVGIGHLLAPTDPALGQWFVDEGEARRPVDRVEHALAGRVQGREVTVQRNHPLGRVWPFVDESGALRFMDLALDVHAPDEYRSFLFASFAELAGRAERKPWLDDLEDGLAALDFRGLGDADDRSPHACVAIVALAGRRSTFTSLEKMLRSVSRPRDDGSAYAWLRDACVARLREHEADLLLPEDTPAATARFAEQLAEVAAAMPAAARDHEAELMRLEAEERERRFAAERKARAVVEERRQQREAERRAQQALVAAAPAFSEPSSPLSLRELWVENRQREMDAAWSEWMRSGDRRDHAGYRAAAAQYRSVSGWR